ncbi:MBL fold metallo-hydrolase [bacterium]|nr:MBL fold metallo-hydrolase [bacterium]
MDTHFPNRSYGRITALGTGTSQGVPVVGCRCAVCTSQDPRDRRLRSSALVELGETVFLIDAGPDLRAQLLRSGVERIDAVLFTHEHQDHTAGLDDLRPLYFAQNQPIHLYCSESVERRLRQQYAYVFENADYPGVPQFEFHRIGPGKQTVAGVDINVLPLWHGSMPVLGFRFGPMAYLTDFNRIEPEVYRELEKLDFLVISALHKEPHHSHWHLDGALECARCIEAPEVRLTHISHRMGLYDAVNPGLPEGVQLWYDGAVWELK